MISQSRRLGRPRRACCSPTTPRCTSATSAGGQLRPEWLDLRRGLQRERTDDAASTSAGATDETAHARLLVALPVPDGGSMTITVDTTDATDRGTRRSTSARSSISCTAKRVTPTNSDYDAWEELWTDDALYWVPAAMTADPVDQMSVIYDNRNRISTRLNQLRTGRRYAQTPQSSLRRLISNVELLGRRPTAAGGDPDRGGRQLRCCRVTRARVVTWGGRMTTAYAGWTAAAAGRQEGPAGRPGASPSHARLPYLMGNVFRAADDGPGQRHRRASSEANSPKSPQLMTNAIRPDCAWRTCGLVVSGFWTHSSWRPSSGSRTAT